jgi:hypothetical protein
MGVSFQANTICLVQVERPFDRLRALSNIEGHQNQIAFWRQPQRVSVYIDQGLLCLLGEVLN